MFIGDYIIYCLISVVGVLFWFLYLISGVVTCKMCYIISLEGFSSLSVSVLNVDSVLRQLPPVMVIAMDMSTLCSQMYSNTL